MRHVATAQQKLLTHLPIKNRIAIHGCARLGIFRINRVAIGANRQTCCVMQERDGFSEQVSTLRGKVSQLARELAEREDDAKRGADRQRQLATQFESAQAELAARQAAWDAERTALRQV